MTGPPLYARGVILDSETFDRGDLSYASLRTAVSRWHCYPTTSPDQVVARIARCEVVISNKVVLDRVAIGSANNLRLIAVAATGTNNIDLPAARDHGVLVCNVPGYATDSVAQHTFALILALAGGLQRYHPAVSRGDWAKSSVFCRLDFPVVELSGKILGVVGYGAIGRRVAEIGAAFGMRILVGERRDRPLRPGRTEFARLVEQADVLTLHCPLHAETSGLLGEAELRAMKPGAFLVNTSRGGLIDEVALLNALRTGRIGGAALDVLGREPPSGDDALVTGGLSNLIVTPHMAWGSREARQRLVDMLAENILAAKNGRPQNLV